MQFIKDITNSACEKERQQPTDQDIKEWVLTTKGPLVTYRIFKHGKRAARSIAEPEYMKALQNLTTEGFGNVIEFSVPHSSGVCKVFVKAIPQDWPQTFTLTKAAYEATIAKPVHKYIKYTDG